MIGPPSPDRGGVSADVGLGRDGRHRRRVCVVHDGLPSLRLWRRGRCWQPSSWHRRHRGGRPAQRLVVTNPLTTYVGDISYSLYLWHFPLIIFGLEVLGTSGATKAGLAVAILVVSVYSFHLVEDPIRRSEWRTTRRHAHHRRPLIARLEAIPDGHRNLMLTGLVLFAVLTSALALRTPAPPRVVALPSVAFQTHHKAHTSSVGPATQQLQGELVSALQAAAWPQLSPAMDGVTGSAQAPDDITACGEVTGAPTGPRTVCGDRPTPSTRPCSWGTRSR